MTYKERENKRHEDAQVLLVNIREQLDELEKLFMLNNELMYCDPIYRFYHHSFKVFHLQEQTVEIVAKLRSLAPSGDHVEAIPYFNDSFAKIYAAGTGKEFTLDANSHWDEVTRPIVEAYFHARFFLEMAIRSGKTVDADRNSLPAEWAALLYFYNLR